MRSKGFTLIEILVVLLIITVVVSLTVLTVNSTGRDSQLDEESRRIVGLVGLLHERALLEGRDFGLRIEPPRPQVAIAASGEGTPFRLILLREATQAKAVVDGDALGKISREDSNKVEKRS
jgi:prepilin-type N-terminal cleavage/methylation domain-containing protein